jgi:hypothetical protein
MSDAPAIAEPQTSSNRLIFERWIFEVSAFGTLATSVLIFLMLVAMFAGAMALERAPLFDPHGRVAGLSAGAWPAVILSLLVSVVLGVQRFAAQKDRADAANYARVFRYADNPASFLTQIVRRRLLLVTVAGILIGIGAGLIFTPRTLGIAHPFVTAWFTAIECFISVLFTRGFVLSTRGAELFAQMIQNNLQIDLLRIDQLSVIGRNGARTALIWFSVAAVICLFFVGGNMALPTFLMLVFAAGMGLWTFVRPMERVHRRIRAAKEVELDKIRRSIAELRGQASFDADAAARLQGLLAYETRIDTVREWPFDQTTALRLAAYVLIPAIPWFGQAIAQYFVERVAHIG